MRRSDHVEVEDVMGAKAVTPLDTVKEIYASFGEGRIEAILSKLSEDVEWEYSNSSTSVPWLQPRTGRQNVAAFFQSLAAIDMKRFLPHTFLDGGQVVVVLLDVEFTVRATGAQVVETDEIHVWRFNAQGLVSRFKHGVDTHRHQLAISSANAIS
ncbi:MAG: nuclear transport factor 2 family protein [Nitrospira sp.]|nr:nuclear transport factor 2 family protein [Nitrospira sp.]